MQYLLSSNHSYCTVLLLVNATLYSETENCISTNTIQHIYTSLRTSGSHENVFDSSALHVINFKLFVLIQN